MMDEKIIKKLFFFIKNNKINNFISILNQNYNNIDINILDNYNNSLLHYAIILNKKKIIELLLKYNCKIDYIDSDGKTILYYPIKYGFNKTIKLIKQYNSKIIGLSIFTIIDKYGNTPLHYAVLYNNYKILKYLLNLNININKINNDKNAPLHIAINNNNYKIIKLLINDKNINVNLLNNNNLSVLHIVCINRNIELIELFIKNKKFNLNILDLKYEMNPLMYILHINYKHLILLMINNGINIDHQNIYGNNILHLSLLDNNFDTFFFLKSIITNKNIYNQININGLTPLHILLSLNIKIDIDIIKITKLNLQDNNGNTCLHIICKNELWKQNEIKNVLKNKKLDIYIINLENKTPLDYIHKNDLDDFIDMISESYYQTLLHKKNIWTTEWENNCSLEINNKNICISLIKNYIKNNNTSIPIKKNFYNIFINNSLKNVKFSTFIGMSLDIISSCLYVFINYNIFVPLYHNILDNSFLLKFLQEKNITRNLDNTEFFDIEILWIQQHIYIPPSISFNIEKYKTSSLRLMIIPIGIELSQGSHANIIIIDKIKLTIERFEPSGKNSPIGYYYNIELLDSLLSSYFKSILPNFIYISSIEYLPKFGFQLYDNLEFDNKNVGDPDGFCLSWCFWYVSEKFYNIDIDSKTLVNKLIINIKKNNIQFRSIIRNFAKLITNVRDNILKQHKLSINDWINNKIDDSIKLSIHSYINSVIS